MDLKEIGRELYTYIADLQGKDPVQMLVSRSISSGTLFKSRHVQKGYFEEPKDARMQSVFLFCWSCTPQRGAAVSVQPRAFPDNRRCNIWNLGGMGVVLNVTRDWVVNSSRLERYQKRRVLPFGVVPTSEYSVAKKEAFSGVSGLILVWSVFTSTAVS